VLFLERPPQQLELGPISTESVRAHLEKARRVAAPTPTPTRRRAVGIPSNADAIEVDGHTRPSKPVARHRPGQPIDLEIELHLEQ
jgi:hypothetical protein